MRRTARARPATCSAWGVLPAAKGRALGLIAMLLFLAAVSYAGEVQPKCSGNSDDSENATKFIMNDRMIYGPLGGSTYNHIYMAYTGTRGAKVAMAQLRVFFFGSPDLDDKVVVGLRCGHVEQTSLQLKTDGEKTKYFQFNGRLTQFGESSSTPAHGWPQIPYYTDVSFTDFRCREDRLEVFVHARFDEGIANECVGVELMMLEFGPSQNMPRKEHGWRMKFPFGRSTSGFQQLGG